MHGFDDNNRQISKKPIYIKPHDIEFRFQINKSMIDLWDSDEKVEDFTRSLYQELMELKFKIHEFRFSSPPFFFFFLFFWKNFDSEKTRVLTKSYAMEGRNPDSYECLSGYVSGVCIEPMATGIKYQSKNPIKLQEFLANRLLSSPSPSPALSRDRLHSLHRLKYSRAQSLLPSQFYYFCVRSFFFFFFSQK